ncbi:MAG: helix-turn-helix domain-containing protein [Bacteroidetes bacterium]|nr:helix-turn-helix domain-containing protein [Bacteroidota bacterium]
MLLKEFIPAIELREWVRLFRIVHFVFGKDEPLPFKAYPPRPEHCLAFFPYDTEKLYVHNSTQKVEHIPVILYGQPLSVTQRFVGRDFLVFQIIFQPGALYRLTGIPADLFTDAYLDAETVFSSELRLVNEQLFHATSYEAMLETGHQFVKGLIRKLRKDFHPIDQVSQWQLMKGGNISVDQMAKDSCLSTRQFERKFKERTGINPKLFARVIRFDKAFLLKNRYPHWDWLRIAIECDFHDYQHLAKTYKDFTGLSPAAFHELEERSPERKFGLSENYYGGD